MRPLVRPRAWMLAWIAVAGSAFGACATHRVDEEPLIPSETVDVRPQLTRCGAGYPEPTPGVDDPAPNYVRVTVPVIVGADGTVVSVGTPQLVHSTADVRNTRLSSSARDQARYQAEGCLFEPAQLLGVAVSARTEVTFVVLN